MELSEPLNMPAGRVQVTVQPLPDLSQDPFWQRLETIWSAQRDRRQIDSSSAAIETEHESLNVEMEEEIQEAIRL